TVIVPQVCLMRLGASFQKYDPGADLAARGLVLLRLRNSAGLEAIDHEGQLRIELVDLQLARAGAAIDDHATRHLTIVIRAVLANGFRKAELTGDDLCTHTIELQQSRPVIVSCMLGHDQDMTDIHLLAFTLDHLDDVVAELSPDRKSTRLNSSHVKISYAVFCLKK